ncbi:hypothetical protein [Roseateles oligotrophus]|uniref:Uncharacterized protein n=1 Tax=Roseateles oligotrophus TaxID=1769250 RepID=A0ABT2YAW5_9BURK|nr:hypothetical protein [Roseateles oligotrophus]MCV2367428.1 hypothetical protein [Roseateles oligotrophus]
MIGILFLIVIAIWLVAAVLLSKRIPRWMGIKKHATVASLLLFPLLLTAPIADELIGSWQFNRLCEREAVVTLRPDWERVKRAQDNDDAITQIDGYVIPISVQRVEFIDADTKQPFLTYKGFHTEGGFLMRHGLGLDGETSCWPKDKTQILNNLNIDQLLKQGK